MTLREKRLRVFEMIQSTGISTEKEFLIISPAGWAYCLPDLKPDEFSIIRGLQEAVREGNLFAFLCVNEGHNS